MEFIDLKKQYESISQDIDRNIRDIISNATFIGGSYVGRLESELASYVGRKYCISCGSGTDALQLAYMAYGIGRGDAVFCPDMTFIASIEPACMLGATPIFCDIESDTYNIDPVSLKQQVQTVLDEGTLNPKAVVAVDFLGNPAKHREISAICEKYGLIHIEDGAQSTGARYFGNKCGALGDISTTSFFPSKPLGCYGDGGAVFTDSDSIAELIQSYKVHGKGRRGKYDNVRIGINSRLDAIQAGVLLPKLNKLDAEITKRQEIAKRYDEAFANYFQIPSIEKNSVSTYAQYCIVTKDESERERIMTAMKKNGIPCLIYYPNALHRLEVFGNELRTNAPNAENYASCNLGIPFSPYLAEADQEIVIDTILGAIS